MSCQIKLHGVENAPVLLEERRRGPLNWLFFKFFSISFQSYIKVDKNFKRIHGAGPAPGGVVPWRK